MSTEPDLNARQAEWAAQERALDGLRKGAPHTGDGHVDGYRLLFQAIVDTPCSEPPADFAQLTLRAVREAEIDEYIERWLLRVAGLVALIGVAVFAGPILWSSMGAGISHTLVPAAGALSSPLLWAAVAAGTTAAGCDGWYRLRHPDHRLAPG